MGQQLTAEERYLLELFEKVSIETEPLEVEVDRYFIGQKANVAPKKVDTIVKQLVRANLVKKSGEVLITTTPLGLSLASQLEKPK